MFSRIVSATGILWRTFSLVVLLSIVATIPILQFASFGYMLESAARVSNGLPTRKCFPGAQTAGRLLIVLGCIFGSWLPVWYLADMAYSAEIIDGGSRTARVLRIAARAISVVWIFWIFWAVFRGGKLRHFIWPAPILALKTLFRTAVWREAEDRLWSFVASLHLPKLLWLGLMGSIVALVWLVLPSSFIVLGLSGKGGGLGLVGLMGAIGMGWVLLHLPFLQIQLARECNFFAGFNLRSARRSFRLAPWSFCLATWATFLLAVPLYLLRIEPPPTQLWWILSLFFVMLMFPAKLCCGWAIRRSLARKNDASRSGDVFWLWRYCAWVPQVSVVLVYLGVLYLAKFALWEGAASIYLQHAFLPPVPFFIR